MPDKGKSISEDMEKLSHDCLSPDQIKSSSSSQTVMDKPIAPVEVPSSPASDGLQSPYGEMPPRRPTKFSFVVRDHLNNSVNSSHTDLVVLATCFTTGLTDTVMFTAFGTFVSMQTGNTIFVALGVSNQSTRPDSWAESLLSIGCYCLGALFFSRLNSYLLPPAQRRVTLMLSYFIQSALIFIAVSVIQAGVVDGSVPSSPLTDKAFKDQLIPIALLSFQSAGQIVASRALNINEVPTVVITSLLCDLCSDAKLLAPLNANVKRNRRVLGFVLLLAGAIVSGWVSKATGRVEPVLWIAGAFKFGIFIAWTFWPWMQPKTGVEMNGGRV